MTGPTLARRSAALLAALLGAAPAAAQQDTTRVREVDSLVVTAERVRTPLVTSTAAVSRVSGEELRSLPLRSVADALRTVPGITFVDNDGLGLDPQLMVRGFYGGGEADYVVVLLDGRPLNGLQAGLYDWDLVPLPALESIEVFRGGASSLYGDAAVGGVVNLVTAGGPPRGLRGEVTRGAFGLWRGSAALDGAWLGRSGSAFAEVRTLDGYRAHAARTTGSLGATVGLLEGARGELSVSTLHHWREFEEPGPLTTAELDASRREASPFYRFDAADERVHRLTLDGERVLGGGAELSGHLVGEVRALDEVRTLPLSPEFADTKLRELGTRRLLGSLQLRLRPAPVAGSLLVGTDWSLGRIENRYFAVATGDADAYRAAGGGPGELDARGEGSRLAAGAFARYELRPSDAVRLAAGARLDWLRDAFRTLPPAEGARRESSHLAFSPRAGVNVRYLRSPRHEGHVFASVGRSFKAPTPDQLFDQRSIPVPFEPYRVTLSNAELDPQYGTGVEAGLYHRVELLPGRLSGRLSSTAYQIDMRDELDVDLETFRYVNIGRSRHRGVETGLELRGPGGVGAYANHTLQSVTFRNGAHEGNRLKAIPKHALGAGVQAGGPSGLSASLSVQSAWGIHLDDTNTLGLPGYTRVDARAAYPVGPVRLIAEVFNLLDREYSTTGFPDPAGSGVVYLYPAAGRALQLGLSVGG
ncbi:MAG: TonB-dependent receptor [Gemmatimonadota bacterium]